MQGQAAPGIVVKIANRRLRAAAIGLVVGALALSIPQAAAQDAAPPPQSNPPAAPGPAQAPTTPAASQPQNPGLIQEIGRLFERGAADLRGHFDGAKQQIDTLNQNATTTSKTIGDAAADVGKTATGVVTTPLNVTRIVSGHERCGIAPNGAPDCITAAEALCKRHGYVTGKSVDFTSAEQCSPTVFLAGRENAPACTTVTFISRAMCQ